MGSAISGRLRLSKLFTVIFKVSSRVSLSSFSGSIISGYRAIASLRLSLLNVSLQSAMISSSRFVPTSTAEVR
ncbi:hypothetical protein [Leptolyngbya sp. FACHB-541]|uniref:hypothetical protein n=1 Tax=Leptolyngbya sp. FACHB-541 TaxID=2692810 RepID=UPI001F5586F9|nr:hypothetical protein [Leptolyngbya sp. FACHB-541]